MTTLMFLLWCDFLALEHNGRTRLKRRSHIGKSKHYELEDALAPCPRSRSIVVSRSPSPSRGSPMASRRVHSPPQQNRLHLSDGSDSDPVTNGRHVEGEWSGDVLWEGRRKGVHRRGRVMVGTLVCLVSAHTHTHPSSKNKAISSKKRQLARESIVC